MRKRKTAGLLAALFIAATPFGGAAEPSSVSEDDTAATAGSVRAAVGNRNVDVSNPANHGILDDRTSRYDYMEHETGSPPTVWGTYRIAAGTVINGSRLSPRMERRLLPRVKPRDGNYQHFKGTFRIEEVGGGPGTYIIQAKGKHHEHVNVDPALCLIMARKVIKGGETCFDLYREEITKRGGTFSNGGRRYVKLTTVKKNERFELEMKTGFSGSPVNRHYANVRIKGKWYNWDVPAPQTAMETGIRYGAYTALVGIAVVHVCDTSYTFRNNR